MLSFTSSWDIECVDKYENEWVQREDRLSECRSAVVQLKFLYNNDCEIDDTIGLCGGINLNLCDITTCFRAICRSDLPLSWMSVATSYKPMTREHTVAVLRKQQEQICASVHIVKYERLHGVCTPVLCTSHCDMYYTWSSYTTIYTRVGILILHWQDISLLYHIWHSIDD